MKISIKVPEQEKEQSIEIAQGCSIQDALTQAGINIETYLIKLNNELSMELETLKDGDYIELIKIISGG